MFLQNKYTRWYFSIIENAKRQQRIKSLENYYEKHHIIPKCLDGSNKKENLVILTFKEHFICHWLLCKMTNDKKYKLYFAFSKMTHKSNNQKRILSSFQYKLVKNYNIIASKNRIFSKETKEKMSKSNKLIWDNSPERKKQMSILSSIRNKNVSKSKKIKEKISKSLTGIKHTNERNIKKSLYMKKTYIIKKLDKSEIIISDLKNWCKLHNYNYTSLFNLKSKKILKHKDIISMNEYSHIHQ
jgi:hypothetical protein